MFRIVQGAAREGRRRSMYKAAIFNCREATYRIYHGNFLMSKNSLRLAKVSFWLLLEQQRPSGSIVCQVKVRVV